MAKEKSIEIWEKAWDSEIHTTDYAEKRIKSAQSAKLTPIKIDTENCYGYFQGSHGKYETFLTSCPCGDFRRSKKPCKHIYRLAIELGLMDIEVKKNINAVQTPKNERISLDETINIIERISEDAQRELLSIAANIRSTSPTYSIKPNTHIIELLQSGILIDTNPGNYTIDFSKKRKDEIIELLDSENIECDKKAKKSELQKICIEQIAEKAADKFGKFISVSIPTKFSSQKIHYYLHRKYGVAFLIDEKMQEYQISLLDTDLPDDDVTNQLINHGYYQREGTIKLERINPNDERYIKFVNAQK